LRYSLQFQTDRGLISENLFTSCFDVIHQLFSSKGCCLLTVDCVERQLFHVGGEKLPIGSRGYLRLLSLFFLLFFMFSAIDQVTVAVVPLRGRSRLGVNWRC